MTKIIISRTDVVTIHIPLIKRRKKEIDSVNYSVGSTWRDEEGVKTVKSATTVELHDSERKSNTFISLLEFEKDDLFLLIIPGSGYGQYAITREKTEEVLADFGLDINLNLTGEEENFTDRNQDSNEISGMR